MEPISAGNSTGIVMDLTASFGAMFIGSALSFVIWGIICMQAFIYYASYPNDSALTQLLIFALWAMDTTRLILEFIALWNPLIRRWGDPNAVRGNLHIMLHSDWLGAGAIIIVQFFFLWRIYVLGGYRRWKWAVIAFVVVAGIFQFAVTVFFDIRGLQGSTLATENSPLMKRLQLADRTCTAAIDVIICVSLVKLLLQNGIPVYSRTRQLLYRGILVTINTGLWTAVLSIIDLVLMGAQQNNFYYCIVELPIQSLYVVTLLSNLCARSYVKGKGAEWDEYLSTLPEDPYSPKTRNGSFAMSSTYSDHCPGTAASQASSSVVSTEIAFAKPGTVQYQSNRYDRPPKNLSAV